MPLNRLIGQEPIITREQPTVEASYTFSRERLYVTSTTESAPSYISPPPDERWYILSIVVTATCSAVGATRVYYYYVGDYLSRWVRYMVCSATAGAIDFIIFEQDLVFSNTAYVEGEGTSRTAPALMDYIDPMCKVGMMTLNGQAGDAVIMDLFVKKVKVKP